jgi:hypothetical protein
LTFKTEILIRLQASNGLSNYWKAKIEGNKKRNKMENLQKNIIGITFGIRFARSFRIPDISGCIMDNILYSENTPFGTKFFPNLQEISSREKTLYNSETSEYLRINTDDLILGIKIDNDFQKKFDWLKIDVFKYFSNTLFREYEIQNIRRVGIVFSHKLSKNKKLNEAISLISGNTINSADNINISFSKKIGAIEALYRKNVTDYKNTIYNFNEVKEAIHAALDYQYYYEPAIQDLRECFVDKILDDAKVFLENNYYTWLTIHENK